MPHEAARKERTQQIIQEFPATVEGRDALAARCAWVEIRLAELLNEKQKKIDDKAKVN